MQKRQIGRTFGVFAVSVAAAVAIPAGGHAAPTPAAVGNGIPVDALAALAPAIIGAAAGPADIAAPVNPNAPRVVASPAQNSILTQAKQLLANAALPPQIKTALQSIITFLDGSKGGGPDLPPGSGPVIAQFLYPSIGKGCISATGDSVATALAVPGPAKLPPPGPKAGQTGFVFTALGTKGPTDKQDNPITVTWLNIDNRRTQTQTLTTAAKINPTGPATLSVIADTGPGRVLAVISGGLTTQAEPTAAPRSCSFLPTVGMFTVR